LLSKLIISYNNISNTPINWSESSEISREKMESKTNNGNDFPSPRVGENCKI
jgi:hypothetical protein